MFILTHVYLNKYVHNCTNNIAHSLKCDSSITSVVISLYHSAVEVYTHHSTVGNVTWMQKTASQTHATLYMHESAGFTSFGCRLLYQSQTKLYYNSANPGMTSLTHKSLFLPWLHLLVYCEYGDSGVTGKQRLYL